MGSVVVIVHADSELRAAARETLELAGHTARETASAEGMWRLVETADVILLPWLGGQLAKEALAQLREHPALRELRILVWTARAGLAEAVRALEIGADDCFGVPFEPEELVARVNACLRRPATSAKPDRLTAGPLMLDRAVHSLSVSGKPVELAPTEYRLLAFLLENQSECLAATSCCGTPGPRTSKRASARSMRTCADCGAFSSPMIAAK